MGIKTGDKLPDATFRMMGDAGPEELTSAALFDGKTVALFAVPGAFTPTCSVTHVPSFMRVADDLAAKGVDTIACVSVNDVFVMKSWAEATGADKSPILMLSDPQSEFTKAIGMDFTAPPVGLIDRSKRYTMLVKGGEVAILNAEESPGECEISAGEALLDTL